MAKPRHSEEIEIKLRIQDQDIDAVRSRLKRLRARQITPRSHESNTLYDTSRQELRRRGQLIRIRTEQPASSSGKGHPEEHAAGILTYKGPPRVPRGARKAGENSQIRRHFKIKDEQEVTFHAPDNMARILVALGFHPVFRYEKYRTTYVLPGIRGLKIELDETPVGIYLELEGPITAIDRGARLLGFDRKDYLKDTYGSLYLAACRRRDQKPGNMLFPPTKKLR